MVVRKLVAPFTARHDKLGILNEWFRHDRPPVKPFGQVREHEVCHTSPTWALKQSARCKAIQPLHSVIVTVGKEGV